MFAPCTKYKFLQRTWKTTNLYVGFDPYFGVAILILAFFRLCILISKVGAICRKIIIFSSSLRADTWFWSIHSSHEPFAYRSPNKNPFLRFAYPRVKKKILSNFCYGEIRFMNSRKETRTSGILAIFGDLTIIFKCKNYLAPSYYKISIKRCF